MEVRKREKMKEKTKNIESRQMMKKQGKQQIKGNCKIKTKKVKQNNVKYIRGRKGEYKNDMIKTRN